MLIKKRNGNIQELDLTKIHAVLEWACNGSNADGLTPIKGVSVSQIEIGAQLHFYEKMETREIHETLIKAARDLISEDYPNYDQVAARLVWFAVRKEAFANNLPPHLSKVIKDNIARGVYTPEILQYYDEEELDEINSFIKHNRDDLFRYAGSEQMRKKYLCQNRSNKEIYESFQFPYILVAAILFHNYPKDTRLKYVKAYYDLVSTHYISLPTPIMAGLRTKEKQFSSCVLVSAGDSLDSINAVSITIVGYASRKAGLGIDGSRIRAIGQPIRNGSAITTGQVPFIKYFNAALKSCSQGAVRGAAGTYNYPFWHLEFATLIELKNEKGTEETRVRTLDYAIHLNKFFYDRFLDNGIITFFSPEEVPDLYEAFYSPNVDLFKEIYEKYEANPTITKKQLSASEVFGKILNERFETSRIYVVNADLANTQTPFYEYITLTNLCTEILLPTTPLEKDPEAGRIALCTLSAVNWGKFTDLATDKEQKQIALVCEMAVRGLDALLSYQNYPFREAELAVQEYRPLGIGIIGFAHWLAKNQLRWGEEETVNKVDNFMEVMAWNLTSTSIKLAQEFGSCNKRTKYHDGWMPIDDSPRKTATLKDWNSLRTQAQEYGIRNATLMAMMPAETSAQLANETNGIEPPKSLVTIKGSKDGVLPQLVPEYARLNPYYETLWNVSAENYLKTLAPIQRYVDQAISANTSYDPTKTEGRVKLSVLAKDMMLAHKLGIKTLYYNNVRDSDGVEEDDGCESGACKI